MKIGILTPHYAFNYGAVLQAFALLTYLKSQGHDVVIINRRPPSQAAVPSLLGRVCRKIQEHTQGRNFIANEIKHLHPQTVPIILQQDLPLIELHFDAIIVGSDQVWRDDYAFNSFGYNVFLDFVDPTTRKISYAPSFGKDTWERPEPVRQRVAELLHDFHAISVREASGVDICRRMFDVEATHVIDPTFLLVGDDYLCHYGLSRQNGRKPFVAGYILDGDEVKRKALATIAHKLGMDCRKIIFDIYTGRLSRFVHRFYPIYPSVETWLRNIANSDFVVTNSFHGMAFSIIFRKQFIVFGNKERGMERFSSMLQMLGLGNRLLDWEDDVEPLISTPIDYHSVEPLIAKWKDKSKAFLNNALR